MRVSFAVLTFGAKTNAVGQDGLKTIKVGANDVRMLVGHNPNQMLPNALAHDPRFTVIHVEAFFHQDRRHMN